MVFIVIILIILVIAFLLLNHFLVFFALATTTDHDKDEWKDDHERNGRDLPYFLHIRVVFWGVNEVEPARGVGSCDTRFIKLLERQQPIIVGIYLAKSLLQLFRSVLIGSFNRIYCRFEFFLAELLVLVLIIVFEEDWKLKLKCQVVNRLDSLVGVYNWNIRCNGHIWYQCNVEMRNNLNVDLF